MESFSRSEMRILRSLSTPEKIQNFLDALPYHHAGTAFSPKRVLQEGTAHCLEGAIFAAAAMRIHGAEPLLFDLEAEGDSDHVLALYKKSGAWGAIGISNFSGLRFRPAIYKNLRELALSYFVNYFNMRRQLTLRRYSSAVNLKKFDAKNWMIRPDNVWFIAEHLCEIPHKPLISPAMSKNLKLIDKRSFQAGCVGMSRKG
jgi:hypothetical protein